MTTTHYPQQISPSNSVVDHLEAAGELLRQEAADLLSGRQARQLEAVAQKLQMLAMLLAERRAA